MKIYVRKIDAQCLSHQISFTKEILREFFDDLPDQSTIKCIGKKSNKAFFVKLLLATDPRFSADMQKLLNEEGNLSVGDLLLMAKGKNAYSVELIKPSDSRHDTLVAFYDNERHNIFEMDGADLPQTVTHQNQSSDCADNILLYGVPGCGKSYTIKTDYCDDEKFMERVVFHPDYTYSDFVGQILPTNIAGHISYPFTPGPFTRILKKAVNDSNKENKYYLIIEELNRGNAPAIFGEIFQLLDRKNGESEYGISNFDIANEVYGDGNHPVKIPNNLYILATMNTADQNVFTLDTAFKRRWRMKSIPNDISKCPYCDEKICDSNVTWREFVESINKVIVSSNEGNIGMEDKRIGAFFLTQEEIKNKDQFSEKVLMYLWNDVFKYDPEKVFRPKYQTLEDLVADFKTMSFSVFSDALKF